MSSQPLPTKLADLTPGQLHSLQDYTQAVNERQAQLVGALGTSFKAVTPGAMLRTKAFREDYAAITTAPDRHKRGANPAGGKLAVALERFGYRPAYAEWAVGDTPGAGEK